MSDWFLDYPRITKNISLDIRLRIMGRIRIPWHFPSQQRRDRSEDKRMCKLDEGIRCARKLTPAASIAAQV